MKRQLFGVALVKAAAFFFGYAANYLLILTLPQVEFGRFSLVMAIASIAAMLVSLGHPQIVMRTVAGVLANGNHNRISEIWRVSNFWIIGIGAALGLLALLSFGLVSDRDWALQLIAASAILPIWALLKLHAAVLHGANLTTIGQGVETVLRPAVFCVAIGISVLFAKGEMQAVTALWLNFVAFAFAFCFALAANLFCETYGILKAANGSEINNSNWFRASFLLSVISASQLVILNTDVVMIGLMMSDEDVAVYRVAMLIALLSGGVTEIVTVVVRPRVAAAFASAELDRVVPTVRRLALLATVASLLLLGLFLLLGETAVVRVFGDDYAPAFPVAAILIVAQVVSAYLGPVGIMLNMAHLERAHLGVVIGVIAANITLNFLLIPLLGLYGAAYASLTTMCIWRFAGAVQFERHTGIRYLKFRRS